VWRAIDIFGRLYLSDCFYTTFINSMKALVTGFDAFGGDAINPSYEAVRRLPPRVGGLAVVTAELPTSFARAPRKLRTLLAREQPDIVLCVGLAAERVALGIERVAVNLCHARIADNDGRQPVDKPVIARGPAAYFSTLPVVETVKALQRAGLRAEMSLSAGAFVCNHVFYSLMHEAAKRKGEKCLVRAGFVHVPALPPEGTELALAGLVRGLEIVLRVAQRRSGDRG
jgi:pyroglutamyl-peptidase